MRFGFSSLKWVQGSVGQILSLRTSLVSLFGVVVVVVVIVVVVVVVVVDVVEVRFSASLLLSAFTSTGEGGF